MDITHIISRLLNWELTNEIAHMHPRETRPASGSYPGEPQKKHGFMFDNFKTCPSKGPEGSNETLQWNVDLGIVLKGPRVTGQVNRVE